MPSVAGKRTKWIDLLWEIAIELGKVNPGRALCLKCKNYFSSEDVIYNRICPHCTRLNYDVILNENCEDEFLFIEDPDTNISDLDLLLEKSFS